MFDNYLYNENSTKNVYENGKIIGFQLQTFITYYRGVPLSMIHEINVSVDKENVSHDAILFSANGKDFYKLDEMETMATVKWEYGDAATIRVLQPGGLSSGKHEITFTLAIRVAYIPVPFGATKTRTITI